MAQVVLWLVRLFTNPLLLLFILFLGLIFIRVFFPVLLFGILFLMIYMIARM